MVLVGVFFDLSELGLEKSIMWGGRMLEHGLPFQRMFCFCRGRRDLETRHSNLQVFFLNILVVK